MNLPGVSKPHRVNNPYALLAFLVTAAVVLMLVSGSQAVAWRIVLSVVGIALLAAAVWMASRYLQREDPVEEKFEGFEPEAKTSSEGHPMTTPAWDALNNERNKLYTQREGIMLVHVARPSEQPGQRADIIASLHQHSDGPLSRGEVESVEYVLGPKFTAHTVTKTNAKDAFSIEFSVTGPLLLLAKVNLRGGRTLILDRYVNFVREDDDAATNERNA